jgi:prepilin-type N-terminal cleavage/methylation domain-containing protein
MKRDTGFTLLEAMIVVALVSIGTVVSLIQMKSSMAVLDADKAANLVSGQLRYAREVAVDQRRNVTVDFVGTNRITITRADSSGATLLSDVYLPTGYTYQLPSSPSDTPEGYAPGTPAPVYFNGGTSGVFLGDGTLVNGAGTLINGTVFTRGSNNGSARALTLSGASGRLKQYYLQGSVWVLRG